MGLLAPCSLHGCVMTTRASQMHACVCSRQGRRILCSPRPGLVTYVLNKRTHEGRSQWHGTPWHLEDLLHRRAILPDMIYYLRYTFVQSTGLHAPARACAFCLTTHCLTYIPYCPGLTCLQPIEKHLTAWRLALTGSDTGGLDTDTEHLL